MAKQRGNDVSNWQPIETAPKDGTKILIFDNGVYTARWKDEARYYQFETRPGWQIYECDDGFYSIATDAATHWMPLPANPW
jgi:hypothetical protein